MGMNRKRVSVIVKRSKRFEGVRVEERKVNDVCKGSRCV